MTALDADSKRHCWREEPTTKLERRTVLITGGTSGIGLELARQLLARGNIVIVNGRDQDTLVTAAQAFTCLHTVRSDVSDPEAVATLLETVLARFPTLDTLVNNAGIMRNLKLNERAQPSGCDA